jgi:hypothetical protein
MRLLQLNPNGDEATALDLHPMITVVTDLSTRGRDRLLHAARALPAAGDPGTPGLIEAHGILLDLDLAMLELLDLHADRPVIVTAEDVRAAAKAATSGSSGPEQFLAATPAGIFRDLDELRARQAQARQALELLREARDKARQSLVDARVHRRRTERALEAASAAVARRRLRLVTDTAAEEAADVGVDGETSFAPVAGEDRGPADAAPGAGAGAHGPDEGEAGDVGPDARSAPQPEPEDPAALDVRRQGLQAVIARIDRGVTELTGMDFRPIQVLLDAIRNPEPTRREPSERAQELAAELASLQRDETGLEQSLEARGLGYRSAMARLDGARTVLAAAEQAMRPPEFTEQDRVDLEAAHDEVLAAEGKARGRAGKRRLEEAIEREQAILDRMGFPTWSAYVMGSTLMGIDPAAEQRLEEARFEHDAAERHWSDVAAMIEADPVHRELLNRLEALYVEAFELLGEDEDHPDQAGLEERLRTYQVPSREVSPGELVDALAYQLELIGMGLPPESVKGDRVVLVAEAFLEEASAIQDRIAELGDQRVDALIELQDVEERLARLTAATGPGGRDDHPSIGYDTSENATVADVDELESQLEAAAADEHDYTDMVEARETLVDAAIQVETVATGRLHKRAGELAAERAAQRERAPGGADSAAEVFLLARVDALRSVSYAGSVPLLLDDALADLDDDGKDRVLTRLDQVSDDVQVVYVTGGDRAVVGWAERVGFERAAVVRAPAEFA